MPVARALLQGLAEQLRRCRRAGDGRKGPARRISMISRAVDHVRTL